MNLLMPFGCHCGRPLSDVPTPYLRWLMQTCRDIDPDLRAAVRVERTRRGDAAPPSTSPRERLERYHRDVDHADRTDGREVIIRTLRLMLTAEHRGDLAPGPLLDELWHLPTATHAELKAWPRRNMEPAFIAQTVAAMDRNESLD